MQTHSLQTRRWILIAIVSGLATLMTYMLATQLNPGLSLRQLYVLFMFFGPLFCIANFALYKVLKEYDNSIALQTGTLLLIVGGAINTIMVAMQGALRLYFNELPHGSSVAEAAHTAWQMGLNSGNALQLGTDVAWDIFALSGMILWGIAFSRHPYFGRWFGWPAMVIGAGGLILNCWTFPMPPAEAGLFDGGPLMGLWFLVVTIQLMRHYRSDRAVDNIGSETS